MTKPSKRMSHLAEKLEVGKNYLPAAAFDLLKECGAVKFTESVDVSINLGLDPKKGDQSVRGAANLPHGLGRTVRVAVFTQGAQVAVAEQAGADVVGLDDLAERVKSGDFDFDVVIASPDVMSTLGKLGRILGPKGLMPNPKTGTVTDNLADAIKNAKAGQAQFRADKGGIVHAMIGKLDFPTNQLEDNLDALLGALSKARPATAKGVYFKKVTVSSTMGPGLTIDRNSIAY